MIKTALLTLFAPPGLAIWPGILALYYWRRNVKLARTLVIVGVVLGWGFSCEAVGRFISTALISQVRAPGNTNPDQADMIVVLTGGIRYVGEAAGWQPTDESFKRAMVAYEVQSRVGSRTPILISGGKTKGPRFPSEAQVIRDVIDRTRAQITPVILEESSLSTYENATESARIIRERNASTVLLVTSEIHMLRALAAFRGRGIDPVPIPVFTLSRGTLTVADFLPSVIGVKTNYEALYEIFGLGLYLLSGQARWSDVFYTNA